MSKTRRTTKKPPTAIRAEELASFPGESIAVEEPITHVERLRPTGPAERNGEPAPTYTSEKVRISWNGDSFVAEVNKELTDREIAMLNKLGFDDVSGDGTQWMVNVHDLRRSDPHTYDRLWEGINNLGPLLDGKYDRLMAGRTR